MPIVLLPDSTTAGSIPPSAPVQRSGLTNTGASTTACWPLGTIENVDQAILHTLVYADIFDYPLSVQEIHRYLTGYRASLPVVAGCLKARGHFAQHWSSASQFWFLAGHEHLVALRQERESFSQVLWQAVHRYGRLIAALPFIRSVSITGSLAMHNVSDPQDDIDLLIITAENRVWLGRGLVLLIVHLARRFGVELCPNYVMAEHRLQFGKPSLYIAHELAQLLPLHGLDIYHRLLQNNAWMADYLPNASPFPCCTKEIGPLARHSRQFTETLMKGRLGDNIERWERQRKIPRLRQLAIQRGGTGTTYTADLCKGHVDDHTTAVHRRYAAQLAALGLTTEMP